MHRCLPRPRSAWLLAACLLAPMDLSAQSTGSALLVRVRSAVSHQPLVGSQVVVRGTGLRGTTDAAGEVRFLGLSPGPRTVDVLHLGFEAGQASLGVPVDGQAIAAVELVPHPIQLAAVKVRARARSMLDANGFYDRKRRGGGTFVSREEIERARPRFLSDMLRRMPGVGLAALPGGQAQASFRGAPARSCPIQYYVDGTPVYAYNIDDVSPHDVDGLEIYRGPSTVPIEFNRGTAQCGVILIWTRVE